MADQDPPKLPSAIDDPNIDDPVQLDEWLDKYVQKPFIGFEAKRHPDGTPYSFEDQVKACKDQLRGLAKTMPELGMKKEIVIFNFKEWVIGLQKGDDEP